MHGTLYIHTGMPKTGSTSIQRTCFVHRDVLMRAGYYYADFFWNHVWALEAAYRTVPERPIVFHDRKYTQPFDPSTLSDVRSKLESALTDHSDRNCILSGETVVYWGHEHFRKLQEGIGSHFDRVKVVVYVRHPVLWASSVAQHGPLRCTD